MEEQSRQEHMMALANSGVDPDPPRPKYRKQEKRIFDLVKKFDTEIQDGSFLKYMESIAHNVHISIE